MHALAQPVAAQALAVLGRESIRTTTRFPLRVSPRSRRRRSVRELGMDGVLPLSDQEVRRAVRGVDPGDGLVMPALLGLGVPLM